ncbi:MAG: V-type ATP synthase subunit D [Thermoproteales archaeon]|nr:V-type ATP synthase subunit D [Thermoproteales archaeon]
MSTRVTISRGALMEIRRRIELAERGKEILEMRRDQLIGEAFRLAREVEERRRLEERLALIVRRAQLAYLLVGPREFRSYSQLVEPPKVRIVSKSLLGVIVPRIMELERPEVSRLSNPALRRLAEELWDVIGEFIRLAAKEAALELLCEEIGYLNRIVNSLERRLIPELMEEAHYIKLMLEERSIEEFIRVKKLRDRLRERSWLSRFT